MKNKLRFDKLKRQSQPHLRKTGKVQMTTHSISLEQLAEKLHGNLWIKGDLKRIYLDKGWNTRKMSTKTFVWQDEHGNFKVSCKIDCPSQPWEWIKSQENEVKKDVYESIEDAISDTVYIMTNENGNPVDWNGKETELNGCEFTYRKSKANQLIADENYHSYKEMPRYEFEAEVARLDEQEQPERERIAAEAESKKISELAAKEAEKAIETKKLKESGAIQFEGARVKHGKFGTGTVISSNADTTEIHFDNPEFGLKKLMTKFVKLEVL